MAGLKLLVPQAILFGNLWNNINIALKLAVVVVPLVDHKILTTTSVTTSKSILVFILFFPYAESSTKCREMVDFYLFIVSMIACFGFPFTGYHFSVPLWIYYIYYIGAFFFSVKRCTALYNNLSCCPYIYSFSAYNFPTSSEIFFHSFFLHFLFLIFYNPPISVFDR